MTPDDSVPDDEQEAVRRLLSSAATPEPLPPEIAARLDDVLAGLVAERAHPVVVPLRRRRWPQVLVAAAGLTVFGLVGAQLLQSASQQQGDSATVGAAAEDSEVGSEAGPGADDDRGGVADRDGEAPAEEAAPLAPTTPTDGPQDGAELDAGTDAEALSRALRLTANLNVSKQGYLLNDGLARDSLDDLGDATYLSGGPGSSLRACARSASQGLEAVALGAGRFALVATSPVGRTSSFVTVYPCGEPRLPLASYVALALR